MKENSEEKYIVKIISVPASQKQLDALLLTGAYQDAAAAAAYFKELADGIVKEAQLLQQLSKLEGFLPYEGWQVVPMEDNRLGYEVYLVGSYKRSLEKFLRRNTMTHLSAVNLGLDLCSALSVCRRAGFMHVDLKPSNIFLSGEREYRIGDLGFAKLSSLKYSSLPSKYISSYTPPELHDALATLNPTADIYAVGLILYQIYNNGQLPFEDQAPAEPLPSPMNADYEMAEIILKACHPNPRHRWQTPIEMGQALVSYMQRNTVNDVPILPPVAQPVAENQEADAAAEHSAELPDETIPGAESADALSDAEMTEEANSMLAQADDLLAHKTPDLAAEAAEEIAEEQAAETEAQAEEHDENTIAAIVPEEKNSADGENDDDDDDYDDYDDDDDDVVMINDHGPVGLPNSRRRSKKGKGWIGIVVLILVLALAAAGGIYYYSNYYLLPIDNMDISTFEDTITVNLTTEVDESLLSVVCTDTYGNTAEQSVSNGQAVFTGLNPDTTYEITVEASGFHKASESCVGTCSTAKQTEIVDFTAKTGNEDGSVILSFTVNGPESQDWIIEYSAEGEETQSVSFTGHMVSVTGLTMDRTYSFNLLSASSAEEWIVGTTQLEYTASPIVVAENLAVLSETDGVLTVQWDTPADASVTGWTVRCYSDSGYDQSLNVTENTAQFSEIDTAQAYTLEVTAAGMTQSARSFISANPARVSSILVDDSKEGALTVSWSFEGSAPEGGWLLMYSVDGGKTTDVVKCADASGTISLRIPKAIYQLTIQAADGSTVFGGSTTFTCPDAADFDQYYLEASDIMVSFCHTPDKKEWTYDDVEEYSSTYVIGDEISMVLYASKKVSDYSEDIEVTYIFRDAEGHVLLDLMTTETKNWYPLWNGRYAYLNLPAVPAEAGEYTLDLYFNDGYVLSKNFSITEVQAAG